jgi:hypothetical protein
MHRLRTGGGQIQHRQSAVTECNAGSTVGPDVVRVRTAVRQRARNTRNATFYWRLITIPLSEDAGNPAHNS